MRDLIRTILFCLLNAASTSVVKFGGGSGYCPLFQRDIPGTISGIRLSFDLFLMPHLSSVFLSFSHISSYFLHCNMCGTSLFMWTQFLGQVGVGHNSCLCITFPVGSSFDARCVDHLKRFPGAFAVVFPARTSPHPTALFVEGCHFLPVFK